MRETADSKLQRKIKRAISVETFSIKQLSNNSDSFRAANAERVSKCKLKKREKEIAAAENASNSAQPSCILFVTGVIVMNMFVNHFIGNKEVTALLHMT